MYFMLQGKKIHAHMTAVKYPFPVLVAYYCIREREIGVQIIVHS